MAQLDLAPTLAAFASRSATSKLPRFGKDSCPHARLVGDAQATEEQDADAACDEVVCQKPSWEKNGIRESRIMASSSQVNAAECFRPAR